MDFKSLLEEGILLLTFVGLVGATLGAIWKKGIGPVHAKVEKILAIAEHTDYELRPNGGASLRDEVSTIAKNAVTDRTKLEAGQVQIKRDLEVSQVKLAAELIAAKDEIKESVDLRNTIVEKRLSSVEQTILQAGMEIRTQRGLILNRLDKVEELHDKVASLYESALSKSEAREMPHEPTEAPEGSAILPRQVISLEQHTDPSPS